jgi:haloalkane dehalogenase
VSTSLEKFGKQKFAEVNGKRMAYIDEGAGSTIVFQRGNPASSHLWRNAMAQCASSGRLIACDMIGMGGSEKLSNSGPDRCGYEEQRQFLFGLWEKLDFGNDVILVLHDWGSALGLIGLVRIPSGSQGSSTWRPSSSR